MWEKEQLPYGLRMLDVTHSNIRVPREILCQLENLRLPADYFEGMEALRGMSEKEISERLHEKFCSKPELEVELVERRGF